MKLLGPTKTEYKYGEELSLSGMTVNAVMKSGSKSSVAISNCTITGYNKKVLGEQIITVSYSGKTTTFKVKVNNYVTGIEIATLPENTSYIEGQNISTEGMVVNAVKANGEKETIDLSKIQINQTMAILGNNTIIVSYKTTNTINDSEKTFTKTFEITVTLEENPQVNSITIGNVEGNFRVEQNKIISISFAHIYQEGVEREVEVEASRINISGSGMEIQLLDETQTSIDITNHPSTIVKYIYIKATETGNKTLSVTVDDCTKNKDITILAKAQKEVKVNGLTDITLYLQKPADNEMVKEDNGYVYTLIPIYFEDEDGNVTKLKGKDIVQLDEINGKVSIIDNVIAEDPDDIPCIVLQGYKKTVVDNNYTIEKVATNSEEMDYIGIAIDTGASAFLKNGYIKISYENVNIQLSVIIQANPLSQLVVTPINITGYCYDAVKIAKLTSGENEENIVQSDLTWEIKNGSEIITNETIAKVTIEQSQVDGSITMSLLATEEGNYTITPKVGEIVGRAITVTIEENPQVDRITIGDVEGNFRVEQTKIIPISFTHIYQEGVEREIEVGASRINASGSGMEVQLLDETQTPINVIERPSTAVKYLSIKATETGSKSLSVTVDSCTDSKDITILAKAQTEVKVNGLTDITLYLQKPADNEMVKEDNGYVYTLIPIYFEDEDGNVTKLKAKDIIQLDETNGKVSIVDNVIAEDPDDIPCIVLQGYKKTVIDNTTGEYTIEKVATNSEEMNYIGIAIDTGAADYLRNGYIKISYEGMQSPLQLNVLIQD